MAYVRKYCGPILLDISNGQIRKYCGPIIYECKSGNFRKYCGPIIAKTEQNEKYIREYCGPIKYQIEGSLNHDEMMGLLILIYILQEL